MHFVHKDEQEHCIYKACRRKRKRNSGSLERESKYQDKSDVHRKADYSCKCRKFCVPLRIECR